VAEDSAGVALVPDGFPVYRRLHGGAHLYRITASDRFDELQRIGGRWVLHHVAATAYPELVRVHEMLAASAPYEVAEEAEWARAWCTKGRVS